MGWKIVYAAEASCIRLRSDIACADWEAGACGVAVAADAGPGEADLECRAPARSLPVHLEALRAIVAGLVARKDLQAALPADARHDSAAVGEDSILHKTRAAAVRRDVLHVGVAGGLVGRWRWCGVRDV